MLLLNKVWGWLVAAAAVVAGVVAIYFKGRNEGKQDEKAKQVDSDLKAQEIRSDKAKQANEVESEVSRLPDDDVQQRLRDKYSRD